MRIRGWQKNLLSAIWCETHAPDKAERLFRLALLLAQDADGSNSASAGIVLIEFQSYLERQGRNAEAATAQKGIRRILAFCWQRLQRA